MSDHLRLRTRSPEDTRELAAAAAAAFRPGDVVSLTGELGAGKTCFVQGAARALGVEDRVTSPTFMLVRSYDHARVPIVHCDVYRLDRLQDVLDLGDEVMAPDRLTFVEWGDAVDALLPDDRLEVELRLADPADVEADRLVLVRGRGDWAERVDALRAAWRRWEDPEQETRPC